MPRAPIVLLIALACLTPSPVQAGKPGYVWAKAWHILPGTHSDESGYFSLCEGLDGTLYVGTAKYGENAFLVAFDPRTEKQRIVIDTRKLCGLQATGYAAQAKIHTRNFVGPSGKIYCGSKQGYRREGDRSEYPGGYLMVYDPRTSQAENLGMPLAGQGLIDVTADERRGLIYVVTCEDQHWMLYDTGTRKYRELGPLLTPYASTLLGADGRASVITKNFELAQYDPADGKITVRPIMLGGQKLTRSNSSAIPTWVLSADGCKAWLVLMNDPTLVEIDLAGKGSSAPAVSHGKMIEGKNPDCRCALSLSPDGRIYAVVRVDNDTGFGSGYLHHLLRYDPRSGKHEDLGVLAVKNPDYFNFAGRDGKKPPWSHGFHTLPDETLTPLHHHMALVVTADGTIYVTVICPFTLLRIDQFKLPTPAPTPGSTYIDAALKQCDRIESRMEEFTRAAETVAERHLAGGLIGFPWSGQTLEAELFGRAGGLVHMGFERPFKKERSEAEKAHDVLVAGWDGAPRADEAKKIEGFRNRGCYVVGFGAKGMPELGPLVPRCHVFFDTGTGADDRVVSLPGGARVGRSNHLVNTLGGWVLCGELIAALTRHGRMPTIWKSYSYPDGPAWGEPLLGKSQFHDEYRVSSIPVGQLGREYLAQIRYLLRRFRRTQLAAVGSAADAIATEVRQGRPVVVASTGHMSSYYIGRGEDVVWARNIETHDNLPAQMRSFDAGSGHGALILRLGYAGLHKDLADVMDRKQQRVVLVTAESPRPEFAALPKNLVTRIDMGVVFGDACVAIEGYPLRVLPSSGVMQITAYEAINVEVLARIGARR